MRHFYALMVPVAVAFVLGGCAHPKAAGSGPMTYETALSDYNRMFDTAFKVLNRYAVVKFADARMGKIEAERLYTNDMLHKTRQTIEARIFRGYRFHELEVRVWNEVEDSEPGPWNPAPRERWLKANEDYPFAVLLRNEVILALTDNAGLKKYDPSHHPYPYIEETPTERRQGPQGVQHPAPESDPPVETAAARLPAAAAALPGEPPIVRVSLENDGEPVTPEKKKDPLSVDWPDYDLYGVGLGALRAGRSGPALIAFRSALDSAPGEPGPKLLAIQAHLLRGETGEAAALLRSALRLHPRWFERPLDVRQIYPSDAAVDAQLAALAQTSGSADVALLLGYLEAATGQRRQAVTRLQQAARLEPEDLEVRILLFRLDKP